MPRPGEVRLLRVLRLGERDRPAGLRGEEDDAVETFREERGDGVAIPDVDGLDRASERVDLFAIRRVPVVGEHDLVATRERLAATSPPT